MTQREIAQRRAQWARFEAWESSWKRRAAALDGAEALHAVGEMVEFYLQLSGGSPSPGRSITDKVEAIQRLRDALGFLPRA